MLQIRDLTVTMKKDLRDLLRGFTFALNPGDKAAIIGEEGNGKSTLLKLLSRLEERGFVKREKEGRNNLYTPLVRREDYLSAESRAFLQRLHGGSLPSLVAALMDSRAISRRDLEELEEILRGGDGGA